MDNIFKGYFPYFFMDVKFALEEYGLSEKEITVYTKLLPLGKVKLQGIAKKVDLPRTTIYNVLTYLSKKGLVSTIKIKGIINYEATEPKKFLDNLDKTKKLMESVLPNLESLKKSSSSSSNAEIYEGSKGLFTILSDIFKIKQEVYYFGSYSLSVKILEHQPEHFGTIRMDRKIPAKIVIDPYDEPRFHDKEYKKITEMRFLESLKDFPCMIFIYGEKIALYTVKGDLVGVIIKNKEIALAMKMIFDIYWKSAKR